MLHEEAAQIEEEMQRFLSEMDHATGEDAHHGVLLERFMELLERRGEVTRKALILFKERKVVFEPGLAQHDAEALARRSA